jgi:Flp pilus assembly pilin Flp
MPRRCRISAKLARNLGISVIGRQKRGAASVEHVGLVLLIALLALAAIASVVASPLEGGRELGAAIARKLRCAPTLPGPCWRDPLTEAYGRPLGGTVRALAPRPESSGGLMAVDFRYCRSASCALPGPSDRLTASNRRTTAFVSVQDRRRSEGQVRISYWLYRPTLGWERVQRVASSAEVAALAGTPLLEAQDPKLVPLETLVGRNHFEFLAGEEPPWRWRVEPVYP